MPNENNRIEKGIPGDLTDESLSRSLSLSGSEREVLEGDEGREDMKEDGRLSGFFSFFRALRYRNYSLFFFGQCISLIGTWMQMTAMGWLVYKLTGSVLLLGLVSFCSRIPSFLLGPVAGVIADRWNRHHMLILTQVFSMVQALILAALVLGNRIEINHIIYLSLFLGLITAFDAPARQSFIVHMVDKREDIGNAIALNSSVFNGAKLIGPPVAGFLISRFGEGICFLINGLSYLAVIAALFMMRIPGISPAGKSSAFFSELAEGFRYAYGSKRIRVVIFLVSLMSLAGTPYIVLMPEFVKKVYAGGPEILGFLMGAAGAGALSGALYLASRKTTDGLEQLIGYCALTFSAGLSAFALSGNFHLSLGILFITGSSFMIFIASCNTLLQFLVDNRMRGRVMSLYTTAFMGIMPIGGLLAGMAAHRFGSVTTVFYCSILCMIGACLYIWSSAVSRTGDSPGREVQPLGDSGS